MSDVILVNRTRRPKRKLTLNVPPSILATRINRTTIETSKKGLKRAKHTSLNVGDAIHIPASGKSVPVPESVLKAPEVQAARLRRDIDVETVAPVAVPPKKGTSTRRRRNGKK